MGEFFVTATTTTDRQFRRAVRTTSAIQLEKQYHKFSAAHFLIFDDGSAERLHGHNYRVGIELEAALSRGGLVLDFKQVKPLVSAILEPLDERFLVAALHPEIAVVRGREETTVNHGTRRYVVPTDEVCLLPIVNSSAECLAEFIANRLAQALHVHFPDRLLIRLAIGVEETPGQRSLCTLHF